MILSPNQIECYKSPRGGWSREALARLGVPWPPPHGWKRELEERLKSGGEITPIAVEKPCRICLQLTERYGLWLRRFPDDNRWVCQECLKSLSQLIRAGEVFFPKPNDFASCWPIVVIAVRMKRFGSGDRPDKHASVS